MAIAQLEVPLTPAEQQTQEVTAEVPENLLVRARALGKSSIEGLNYSERANNVSINLMCRALDFYKSVDRKISKFIPY